MTSRNMISGEALRVAIADMDTVLRRGSLSQLSLELASAHRERLENQCAATIGDDVFVNDLADNLARILRCSPDELIEPARRYIYANDIVTVGLKALHSYAQRLRKSPDRRSA